MSKKLEPRVELWDVDDVIRELDGWMRHFIKREVDSRNGSALIRAHSFRKKADAFERARNILAEEFGEPTKED